MLTVICSWRIINFPFSSKICSYYQHYSLLCLFWLYTLKLAIGVFRLLIWGMTVVLHGYLFIHWAQRVVRSSRLQCLKRVAMLAISVCQQVQSTLSGEVHMLVKLKTFIVKLLKTGEMCQLKNTEVTMHCGGDSHNDVVIGLHQVQRSQIHWFSHCSQSSSNTPMLTTNI